MALAFAGLFAPLSLRCLQGELLLKASPDIEKLRADLEDGQMALGALMSNRFNGFFKDRSSVTAPCAPHT